MGSFQSFQQQASKMNPRCTMGLGITLFVTAIMLSDAAPLKSQAYFNKTAYLPCPFANPQNISRSELVIFWQDQEKLVLYELYLGKEKLDSVDAKYLHRTSFDEENSALQLDNVQIKDQGSYDCFIQRKTPRGLVLLHKIDSELLVLANFSEPEILQVSNSTGNSGINLTCSSTQGYPKPMKMYFWLKTQNSTTEYDSVMQISQDNVTELYTVSISLSLPFLDGVNNATIFCVLKTQPMKILIFSQPLPIAPGGPLPVPEENRSWIVPAVIIFVFILMTGFMLTICKRKKKKPGLSYEGDENHQNGE
ncbi:T-lymphocyte activation antigen CD86 isoform X2 [Nannospalax galili]|uniref:T-lymphocyte activation antigen CD86 isoform X2 n=1 Tax=Nannospalax galili TaxID=1026970 RepID=UPI000819F0B0|nr:T-lymphocyte activation antigen CD86 isoform X2 [Nannospalax galili]